MKIPLRRFRVNNGGCVVISGRGSGKRDGGRGGGEGGVVRGGGGGRETVSEGRLLQLAGYLMEIRINSLWSCAGEIADRGRRIAGDRAASPGQPELIPR